MQDNFQFISEELLLKLNQAKGFITRHHPTIGIVTEEILRSFLKEQLPKTISVAFASCIFPMTSYRLDQNRRKLIAVVPFC
jgi:hypothetical protein